MISFNGFLKISNSYQVKMVKFVIFFCFQCEFEMILYFIDQFQHVVNLLSIYNKNTLLCMYVMLQYYQMPFLKIFFKQKFTQTSSASTHLVSQQYDQLHQEISLQVVNQNDNLGSIRFICSKDIMKTSVSFISSPMYLKNHAFSGKVVLRFFRCVSYRLLFIEVMSAIVLRIELIPGNLYTLYTDSH